MHIKYRKSKRGYMTKAFMNEAQPVEIPFHYRDNQRKPSIALLLTVLFCQPRPDYDQMVKAPPQTSYAMDW